MFGAEFTNTTSLDSTDPSLTDLAQTELLRNVPYALLESIQTNQKTLVLQQGDILLSPEQDNHFIYLLLSGALGVHFGTLNSQEIRVLEPGASVGEMSVIDQSRPSAFVVAKEDSQVFPIHRDLLQSFIEDANPVVKNLLKVLTQWIRANTECMVHNTSRIGELTSHASTDALTGLYNRRWLDEALPPLLAEAVELAQPLCALMVDVDFFKNFNDTHGHLAGDQVLDLIGHNLTSAIRPLDFACRYGGEEFLILLPNINIHEAIAVAERIRKNIEATPITTAQRTALPSVTVSIGVAANNSHSTPESIIHEADAKLYQAKQAGKNRVSY